MPMITSRRLSPPKNGFTLIELMIVVSLSIMLMLAASALFMTFLIGGTKTTSTQLVKNEGHYALSQLEFLLRNATQVLPNDAGQTCTTGMTSIRVRSYDNGVTLVYKELDDTDTKYKIASNSGVFLTSGAVDLTQGPTFDCVTSSDGISQYITITFALRKGTPSVDQAKDIVEATFSGSVNVRSF